MKKIGLPALFVLVCWCVYGFVLSLHGENIRYDPTYDPKVSSCEVARNLWTAGGYDTQVRISVCEDQHYDYLVYYLSGDPQKRGRTPFWWLKAAVTGAVGGASRKANWPSNYTYLLTYDKAYRSKTRDLRRCVRLSELGAKDEEITNCVDQAWKPTSFPSDCWKQAVFVCEPE
jgi:hypothetical protein